MMGAHVDPIQVCALVLEPGYQCRVHRGEHLFREVAAGDPRLIRHDDSGDACVVETANGFGRSRLDSKTPGMIDVPHFLGKCPVTIHEDRDRKSTRLNSSHGYISYAVFCLKK